MLVFFALILVIPLLLLLIARKVGLLTKKCSDCSCIVCHIRQLDCSCDVKYTLYLLSLIFSLYQLGIKRITQLKSKAGQRKPLSVLCLDIKMAAQYSNLLSQNWVYKLMKATLPGPFTYIVPASTHLPKITIEKNKHTHRFKRKEIGIYYSS